VTADFRASDVRVFRTKKKKVQFGRDSLGSEIYSDWLLCDAGLDGRLISTPPVATMVDQGTTTA
jgi:hypothetical protein